MKEDQFKIKESICSFLNGRGGVILFDCHQQLHQMTVVGEKMTKKDNERYNQKFMSYFDNIYPKNTKNQNVILSFVPVVESPWHQEALNQYKNYSDFSKSGNYISRLIKKGQFVFRVKISPNIVDIFYFTHESIQYFYVRKNKQNVRVEGKNIYDLIKKKYKKGIKYE